ncbi:MAG: spore cortex biosynthesis protein YabQ [Clostridia bacterium]|nr:spore cortex biosynthesis protein YabQ [Clostridia bacterium]
MNNQAYTFLVFIINGIIIGFLFDCFRILRKSFKTSDIITYIEDILFWIITGIVTLYFIFFYNNRRNTFLYFFRNYSRNLILYINN